MDNYTMDNYTLDNYTMDNYTLDNYTIDNYPIDSCSKSYNILDLCIVDVCSRLLLVIVLKVSLLLNGRHGNITRLLTNDILIIYFTQD